MMRTVLFLLLSVGLVFAQVELKNSSGSLIGSFSSIQQAYDSIPHIAASSYFIEISEAYNSVSDSFPIVLRSKFFPDTTARVTFRPVGTAEIRVNVNAPVFNLDSCRNIVFDGRLPGENTPSLSIINENTMSDAYCFNIINGSSDILLEYLNVINSTQTDSFGRNISIGWASVSGNKRITVSSCVIEGGRAAVISKGNSAAPNSDILIKDCIIKSYAWVGVKIHTGTLNMTAEGNEIFMTAGYDVDIPAGISISGTSGSFHNVKGNRIHDIQSISEQGISMRGIYVFQSNGASVNIENNFISLPITIPGMANNVYGILMMGDKDYNASVNFNSIYIGGTHYGGGAGRVVSAGIMKNNTSVTGAYKQFNNIIVNERTGGRSGVFHAACALFNMSSNSMIDYNIYYCPPGEGTFQVGWDSVLYNDFSAYQNSSGADSNSYFQETHFVSATDLHIPQEYGTDPHFTGIPLQGILYDIDGDERDPLAPFRGADEINRITDVKDLVQVSDYKLEQNYPNPFNAQTIISFDLKKEDFITLAIYDVLGNRVTTLINGKMTSGHHDIHFNADNLSAGIYFYEISSDEFTATKKMILLK